MKKLFLYVLVAVISLIPFFIMQVHCVDSSQVFRFVDDTPVYANFDAVIAFPEAIKRQDSANVQRLFFSSQVIFTKKGQLGTIIENTHVPDVYRMKLDGIDGTWLVHKKMLESLGGRKNTR